MQPIQPPPGTVVASSPKVPVVRSCGWLSPPEDDKWNKFLFQQQTSKAWKISRCFFLIHGVSHLSPKTPTCSKGAKGVHKATSIWSKRWKRLQRKASTKRASTITANSTSTRVSDETQGGDAVTSAKSHLVDQTVFKDTNNCILACNRHHVVAVPCKHV